MSQLQPSHAQVAPQSQVFAGEPAAHLERAIRRMVPDAPPALKPLLAQLLRVVKNDGVDLPALPAEVMEIQRLLNEPNSGIAEVAQVVQRDLALAGRFLGLANSTLYQGYQKVVTVQQAISRIGVHQASMLVLAILSRAKIFRAAEYEQQAARIYAHSLAAAATARILAREARVSADDAFVAGLLHDIGRVFVLTQAGAVQKKQPTQPIQTDRVEKLAEELNGGFSAMLVQSWGYPGTVISALLHHPEAMVIAENDVPLPEPEERQRLAFVTAAASLMSYGLNEPNDPHCQRATRILAALDISPDLELFAMAQVASLSFMRQMDVPVDFQLA